MASIVGQKAMAILVIWVKVKAARAKVTKLRVARAKLSTSERAASWHLLQRHSTYVVVC